MRHSLSQWKTPPKKERPFPRGGPWYTVAGRGLASPIHLWFESALDDPKDVFLRAARLADDKDCEPGLRFAGCSGIRASVCSNVAEAAFFHRVELFYLPTVYKAAPGQSDRHRAS